MPTYLNPPYGPARPDWADLSDDEVARADAQKRWLASLPPKRADRVVEIINAIRMDQGLPDTVQDILEDTKAAILQENAEHTCAGV